MKLYCLHTQQTQYNHHMKFITNYSSIKDKIVNNDEARFLLSSNSQHPRGIIKANGKNFVYPLYTKSSFTDFSEEHEKQQEFVMKAMQQQVKMKIITQKTAETTIEQYRQLFFLANGEAIHINDYKTKQQSTIISPFTDQPININTDIIKQEQEQSIQQTASPPNKTIQTQTNSQQIIQINTQALRNLVNFTTTPYSKANKCHVRMAWQDLFLDDQSKTIVVWGSRQIGKTECVAQRIFEYLFVPNVYVLVGGATHETTSKIENALRMKVAELPFIKHIQAPKREFTNHDCNSRVKFKSFMDDDNIRSGTYDVIIVDEAHQLDEHIFTEELIPMLETTDGQLIMLGNTPKKDPHTNYFLQQYNYFTKNPQLGRAYRFDYTYNMMMKAERREEIKDEIARGNKVFMREYGCLAVEDDADSIEYFTADIEPPDSSQYILTIDPARKQDRCGFVLATSYNNTMVVKLSGFVPQSYTGSWARIASYFQQMKLPENTRIAIDSTGIGDVVFEFFQAQGMTISYRIQYTSSLTENGTVANMRVGKSILLQSLLDISSSGKLYICNKKENEPLTDEVAKCFIGETKRGGLELSSSGTDDIFNALMTNAYLQLKTGQIRAKEVSVVVKNQDIFSQDIQKLSQIQHKSKRSST